MSSLPRQVFERSVPMVPWSRVVLIVVPVTFFLLFAWEVSMRQLGLHAGDLDDGRDYWAAERRKVNSGPRDRVVIIGDSRILYGSDFAIWQTLTGYRPIQLARVASNASRFLHDLATDEYFTGLVVVGIAEEAYFSDRDNGKRLLEYVQSESPSQRIGHQIYKTASRYLAFLDSDYTLFSLIERHDWPERKDVVGPYSYVWKLSESSDDRETYFWQRLEHDAFLRERTKQGWLKIFRGAAVTTKVVDRVIAKSRVDIERIRARGGEVVWIRPPSSGALLDIERQRFPRERTWDRLLRETKSIGVHFEDYPAMQTLDMPDGSHLSRSSAASFTDVYVHALLDRVDWLRVHRGPHLPAHITASR